MGQFSEFITDGNQKWKGATPSFTAAPRKRQKDNGLKDAARRIKLEPRA